MTTNREWKEGTCPFCQVDKIERKADCFSREGAKICELWFCSECGGFFPRMIMLSTDEEALIAGKKAGGKQSDKRRTPRFPVQFVVQMDFDGVCCKGDARDNSELSEPLIAMVLDAGAGGLCFRYPVAVDEGKEGKMRISLPSVNRSFFAQGRVVRSTPLPDGSYGLGVQFVDVEPEYRDALKRYVDFESTH